MVSTRKAWKKGIVTRSALALGALVALGASAPAGWTHGGADHGADKNSKNGDLRSELKFTPEQSAERANDYTKQIMTKVGIDQKLDAQLPLDLTFKNQDGEKVRFGNLFNDKPAMLMLISYACTQLCVAQNEALEGALHDLPFTPGKEFNLIVGSLDPQEETVMAKASRENFLKKYNRAGAEKGVTFLTGDADSIKSLTKAIGMRYTWDARGRQWVHPDGVILLTPEGRVSRYFMSLNYNPRDIRYGLIESSKHRIGSPLDYLALTCFHYDQNTSQYTFQIWKFMQVAGISTLLLMALGIGLMLRRDKNGGATPPLTAA